ncbi:MAG: alanine dehydrogenase [Candidatus Methanoperedens nitroreducens]|uniref:Alanine dehydrogenase n=1 Tax=Candidatus Methanoperedens nitratireducens TaxID=1392998 RepID=A0A0P7ZCM5_9EURY|nr:alanine dehydrogenase [Candidatus Methanoperedens sp. BLZ2]KAB2947370.1 MAG: alanine dehydrogenase [Candidatus Methanoperedens sp.]KPQ41213.1 MAG: alanine dehydrogenase [Candidatus Methanoperedens sp. BLZ1]MBZ0175486.1 alanine dehydrogenase [Candidatus Methanoperedens nitroreducens]CAG1001976.1 alanine dehydrogenase [Methanosarcinales archaeon]MCX9080219.1 alanine dehydrogenase [Candidatus Methanoperedens sp.]
MENHIIWLNRKEVESLLDMKGTLKVVEEAFRQHGLKKVQMPPKLYLYFKNHNGDLRTMPGYLEEQDITGVKIVNVHPDNPKIGLPTVMALVILNSTETGAPLAIMDGTYLTDMRTGASGGVAVKYLARKNAKTVGFVGTGNQARSQLMAINEIIDIHEIKATSVDEKQTLAFKDDMELKVECEITPKKTIREVCDCDILVTTTPSREPIIMNEWISEGTHINAIGADAPGKEELDPLILKRAKVIVDDIGQASHSGEVNVPISKGSLSVKDIFGELGEVITGKKKARTNDSDVTVFDSTGLAIQDVATADMVYRKALKANMGMKLQQF